MIDVVNLTKWSRLQGIHSQTAYRWLREGMLPVPAVRVGSRSALVAPDAVIVPAHLVRDMVEVLSWFCARLVLGEWGSDG
jgi:predicted site-specific integrase-resolvase